MAFCSTRTMYLWGPLVIFGMHIQYIECGCLFCCLSHTSLPHRGPMAVLLVLLGSPSMIRVAFVVVSCVFNTHLQATTPNLECIVLSNNFLNSWRCYLWRDIKLCPLIMEAKGLQCTIWGACVSPFILFYRIGLRIMRHMCPNLDISMANLDLIFLHNTFFFKCRMGLVKVKNGCLFHFLFLCFDNPWFI
jgi:hypothetical protein